MKHPKCSFTWWEQQKIVCRNHVIQIAGRKRCWKPRAHVSVNWNAAKTGKESYQTVPTILKSQVSCESMEFSSQHHGKYHGSSQPFVSKPVSPDSWLLPKLTPEALEQRSALQKTGKVKISTYSQLLQRSPSATKPGRQGGGTHAKGLRFKSGDNESTWTERNYWLYLNKCLYELYLSATWN